MPPFNANMSAVSARHLIAQLADDLSWLEEHGRRGAGQNASAAELRLAAALVRNCIGPYLDGQPPLPLHVAVVGGAGAGMIVARPPDTGRRGAPSDRSAISQDSGAGCWHGCRCYNVRGILRFEPNCAVHPFFSMS